MKNLIPVICLVIIFFSCEKNNEANNEYGVPSNVDLSVNCPGNGTWYTCDMNSPVAKYLSSSPQIYVNQFDAKVVITDWLVEVYPVEYVNTGVCATIIVGTACDFKPQLTGEVYKGYINPQKIGTDPNGDPIYGGKLKNGWELRYWDFPFPKNLYMNFKLKPNEDKWYQKTLWQ